MAGTESSASSRQSSFNSLARDLELPSEQGCLSIIVLGASGDLAKKKTFPALYHLFEQGFLQSGEVHIFGYARSNLSDDGLRQRIRGYLKGASVEHLSEFLQLIKYVSGSYDSGEGFDKLNNEISEYEMSNKSGSSRRLFYLALPPSVYPSVCKMIRTYCMNPSTFCSYDFSEALASSGPIFFALLYRAKRIHCYSELPAVQ
jgi:glucose-6-phosphate 1-dehydrogenase